MHPCLELGGAPRQIPSAATASALSCLMRHSIVTCLRRHSCFHASSQEARHDMPSELSSACASSHFSFTRRLARFIALFRRALLAGSGRSFVGLFCWVQGALSQGSFAGSKLFCAPASRATACPASLSSAALESTARATPRPLHHTFMSPGARIFCYRLLSVTSSSNSSPSESLLFTRLII